MGPPELARELEPDYAGNVLGFETCLYKQLVRHPCDNWVSVIAAVNPEDAQVYFFEAVALPFGSVSSVIAFNRVARALRVILSKVFMLVVANFFDDFCQLELEILSNSAHKTAELVLELLGWEISKGDDKRKSFHPPLRSLRAVVSFEFDKVPFVRISIIVALNIWLKWSMT